MKLNFRTIGEGKPVLVMHGVFGSADNWQTVGKELAAKYKVYLIDLRNHGLSPHDDAMNYLVMSDDLRELCENEQIDTCQVVGHSMGGKVAMYFACRFPQLVEQLVVVDIAPRYYVPHHQTIFKAFSAADLPTLSSRKEADQRLSDVVEDFGTRQFILKNLQRSSDGFSWKLNLQAIQQHIEDLGQGLPADYRFDGQTLFVRGTQSDYISDADTDLIKGHFPMASIADIEAGHWIHAERPREMLQALMGFLS